MMRRNLSEGSDESPRDVQQLEATERRLARRLQLLDELKRETSTSAAGRATRGSSRPISTMQLGKEACARARM